jgi:hypothetical protein
MATAILVLVIAIPVVLLAVYWRDWEQFTLGNTGYRVLGPLAGALLWAGIAALAVWDVLSDERENRWSLWSEWTVVRIVGFSLAALFFLWLAISRMTN